MLPAVTVPVVMRPNEDLATAEAQGHVHQRVLERALDNSAAHSRLETTNQHSIEVAAGTGHLQNRDAAGGCGVAVATNAEDVVKGEVITACCSQQASPLALISVPDCCWLLSSAPITSHSCHVAACRPAGHGAIMPNRTHLMMPKHSCKLPSWWPA